MSYSKLFGSIIHSTVWRSGKDVQILWITLLAMCDRDGVVESSLPGLADAARLDMQEAKAALQVLLDPDEFSRTPDHGGRRVEPVDGAWVLLNYEKYRDKDALEDRRRKDADRQARKRARDKRAESRDSHAMSRPVTNNPPSAAAAAAAASTSAAATPSKAEERSERYIPLARWWGENHPYWHGKNFTKELPSWADALRKVVETDKKTELEIRAIGEFVFKDHDDQADGFPGWRDNCLTPPALRKKKKGKSDPRTKLEKIEAAMARGKSGGFKTKGKQTTFPVAPANILDGCYTGEDEED